MGEEKEVRKRWMSGRRTVRRRIRIRRRILWIQRNGE